MTDTVPIDLDAERAAARDRRYARTLDRIAERTLRELGRDATAEQITEEVQRRWSVLRDVDLGDAIDYTQAVLRGEDPPRPCMPEELHPQPPEPKPEPQPEQPEEPEPQRPPRAPQPQGGDVPQQRVMDAQDSVREYLAEDPRARSPDMYERYLETVPEGVDPVSQKTYSKYTTEARRAMGIQWYSTPEPEPSGDAPETPDAPEPGARPEPADVLRMMQERIDELEQRWDESSDRLHEHQLRVDEMTAHIADLGEDLDRLKAALERERETYNGIAQNVHNHIRAYRIARAVAERGTPP